MSHHFVLRQKSSFLKNLNPAPQKLLLVYSESQDVKEALDIGVREFVKKTYLIGTLAAIILDILQN